MSKPEGFNQIAGRYGAEQVSKLVGVAADNLKKIPGYLGLGRKSYELLDVHDFSRDFDELTNRLSEAFHLNEYVYSQPARLIVAENYQSLNQKERYLNFIGRDKGKEARLVDEYVRGHKDRGIDNVDLAGIPVNKDLFLESLDDPKKWISRGKMFATLANGAAKMKSLLREDDGGIPIAYPKARGEVKEELRLLEKAAKKVFESRDGMVFSLNDLLEDSKKGFGAKTATAIGFGAVALAACIAPQAASEIPTAQPTIVPKEATATATKSKNPAGYGSVPVGATHTPVAIYTASPEAIYASTPESIDSAEAPVSKKKFVAPLAANAAISAETNPLKRKDLKDYMQLKYDSMNDSSMKKEVAESCGIDVDDLGIEYFENDLEGDFYRWSLVYTTPGGVCWPVVESTGLFAEYPSYWREGTSQLMNSKDGVTWGTIQGQFSWFGTYGGVKVGQTKIMSGEIPVDGYSSYFIPDGNPQSDAFDESSWSLIKGVEVILAGTVVIEHEKGVAPLNIEFNPVWTLEYDEMPTITEEDVSSGRLRETLLRKWEAEGKLTPEALEGIYAAKPGDWHLQYSSDMPSTIAAYSYEFKEGHSGPTLPTQRADETLHLVDEDGKTIGVVVVARQIFERPDKTKGVEPWFYLVEKRALGSKQREDELKASLGWPLQSHFASAIVSVKNEAGEDSQYGVSWRDIGPWIDNGEQAEQQELFERLVKDGYPPKEIGSKLLNLMGGEVQ